MKKTAQALASKNRHAVSTLGAAMSALFLVAAPACGADVKAGGDGAADAFTPAADMAAGLFLCPTLSATQVLNQSCPASTSMDSCTRCLKTKCCQTESTCNGCMDCGVGLKACLIRCDEFADDRTYYACSESCFNLFPSAGRPMAQHLACNDIFCTAECSSSGMVSPCTRCLFSSCRDAYLACHGDPECYKLYLCTLPCSNGDSRCLNACSLQYLTGRKALDELLLCGKNRCGTSC